MTTRPLQQQIQAFTARWGSQLPADVLQDLTRPIAQLSASGAAEQALTEGDQAPDFTLPDAFGTPVTLSGLLQLGPVILTFFRGVWCPYCTLQLRAYQQAWPQLQALGATLVAIAPQTPEHSRVLVDREGLTFAVLSDGGNTVARQYGLVYTLEEGVRDAYQQVGAALPAVNGDDSWELPIPATFIIAPTGRVLLAFVDPDFTHRLEPSALIAALVARLATTAIAQTQRAVRTQQVATLDERRRIARDLHDSVSQSLVGLQLVAQAALDAWETRPQQAHAAVETLQHLARGASVELRTLLFELREEVLQDEGLAGALEQHVAMIRRQSGLAVDLEVAPDLCVAAPQAEALYRIAQEALANVVKHARARRAGVTLAARAGWVGVRIDDDGVGFPPEAREGPPGDALGLRGMRERVQALGGTLWIGNGRTGGAYVQAELPVAREAALTTAAQGA